MVQMPVPLGFVAQAVTAIFVGFIVFYTKRIYDEWTERGDRGEKLERIVVGGDPDAGEGRGLVDVIDDHEIRLDRAEARLDETTERVEALCRKNERWKAANRTGDENSPDGE
jgi:hypothetical protein